MIGHHGLSENVQTEIEQALNHHELIKMRIPALEKSDKSALLETICTMTGGEVVQTIGHVLVLFRKNPKSQKFTRLLSKNAQD